MPEKGQAPEQPEERRVIRPAVEELPAYGASDDATSWDDMQSDPDWLADHQENHDKFVAEDQAEETPEATETPTQEEATEEDAPATEQELETIGKIDPKWLKENHPELWNVYHNMQSDYTRKTQALAEERKELESTSRDDSVFKQKAEWWDQINAMPGLVEHIRAYIQGGPQTAHRNYDTEPGYAELEDLTPQQRSAVTNIIQSEIQKQVQPAVQDLYMREAKRETTRLREELPGFNEHYEEIKDFRTKNPNMTWEQAGQIVLFPKQREMGMKDAMQVLTRKKMASTEEPSPSAFPETRRPVTEVPNRNLSAQEAVDIAARKIGLID